MNRTRIFCLALLAALAAAEPGGAQVVQLITPIEPGRETGQVGEIAPAELYFSCVWRAAYGIRPNRRLIAARVLEIDASKRPEKAYEAVMRVERVIGMEGFKPVEVRMTFLDSARLSADDPEQLYLMNVVAKESRVERGLSPAQAPAALRKSLQESPWHILSMNSRVTLWATREGVSLRTLAMPVPAPAEAWVDGFEAILAASQAGPDDPDPLETLQRLLESPHRSVRILAAQGACNNSVKLNAPDERADAYARRILEAADPAVTRHLAKVYFNARADVLPQDPDLLVRLLRVNDLETAEIISLGGLRYVEERRERVGRLLAGLLEPDGEVLRQVHLLRGMSWWGEEAAVLGETLAALARTPTATGIQQRRKRLAIQLLLTSGAPQADAVALEQAAEAPTPVVLQYVVANELYAAVPKLIEAGRRGRQPWTRPMSVAVALLTGRLGMRTFEEADAWWREIEQADEEQQMIESGFRGSDRSVEAAEALADLDSHDYRRRQAARRKLSTLGTPLPKVIFDAAESASAEKRLTAQRLIELTRRDGSALREELYDAAQTARQAAIDWPGGG